MMEESVGTVDATGSKEVGAAELEVVKPSRSELAGAATLEYAALDAAVDVAVSPAALETASPRPVLGYRLLMALVHQSRAIQASKGVIVIEAPAFMMKESIPVGVQS